MFAGVLQYMEDGSLKVNGKAISKVEMEEISAQYKGVNRIHKPMGLLFWIDCKNGNHKEWAQ